MKGKRTSVVRYASDARASRGLMSTPRTSPFSQPGTDQLRIEGGLLNIQQLPIGVYALRVEEEPAFVPVMFVKQ